jgi:outer membrane protein OmpA-like peptidoglycan-associated protein
MKLSQIAKHPLTLIILGIGAFVAIVLTSTPYFVEIGMEKWLNTHGHGDALVENVDFNPFTGRLSMDNLVVETVSGRVLQIPHAVLKFSWKQLFAKHVYLEELMVQDTSLVVDRFEDVGFRVGGLILRELVGKTDKSSPPTWGVGIDRFDLVNSRVEYQTPEITATYFIDQYTLTGLKSWDAQNTVTLELEGKIDESPVHIRATVVPFDTVRSWDGTLSLQDGSLALLAKAFAPELPLTGRMDIDTKLKVVLQQDGTLQFATEGTVGMQQLATEYENTKISEKELNWQGKLTGTKLPNQDMTLDVDGRLVGRDLGVTPPASGSVFQLAGFHLQGQTSLTQHDDTLTVNLTAGLTGENTRIADPTRDLTLLAAKSFGVDGIHIAGLNDISIAAIRLQQPLFGARQSRAEGGEENPPPLMQATALDVNDTTLRDLHNLSISDLQLNDSQFFIKHSKDGRWQPIDELAGTPSVSSHEQEPRPRPAEIAATPIALFLQNFRITGNSSVRFEDERPFRPFQTTFLINEFLVSGIDTGNPDKAAAVTLDGMVGQYGTAKFSGDVYLFARPLSFDMTGNIKALDLPPLSSYTGQTIGYVLTSGQMDAEIKTTVDKGTISGENELLLRNLEVKPEDPARIEELNKQLNVPLESGLAMLRNKKDEIRLNIPLQGDIENPEFDFHDAINQALGKALKVGAFSYLKFALQPFGTYLAIAQVVGKAGEEIAKVRLDPVEFPAGENSLDEAATQYLEKVASILNDRPKLRVEICGKAVEADRTALRDQQIALMEKQKEQSKDGRKKKEAEADTAEVVIPDTQLETLAGERAQLVKETLANQYGVDNTRMYICLPEIVTSPDSQPQVEMLID